MEDVEHCSSEDQDEIQSLSSSRVGNFSKWSLLLNPNYFFALITSGWGVMAIFFFIPLLPIRLKETYLLSQEQIGLFFLIGPIFSLISTFTLCFILPNYLSNRKIMIMCFFALFVDLLLVGPSYSLGIPEALVTIAVG